MILPGRHQICPFSVVVSLVLISVLLAACGREELPQRLAGVWEDQGTRSKIEFSLDGKFAGTISTEITTNITIRVPGKATELAASLLGWLRVDGGWRPLDEATALVFLAAEVGQVPSEALLFKAVAGDDGEPAVVMLQGSLLGPDERLFQQSASPEPTVDFDQWNDSDTGDLGYTTVDMDVPAFLVGSDDMRIPAKSITIPC